MNFLALLGALVLSYYRPHARLNWLHRLVMPCARWLEHSCNDGKNRHAIFAWVLGAFLPALVVAIIYYVLQAIHGFLGILFGMVVLYVVLRFSHFGLRAEQIVHALREQNLVEARSSLAEWEVNDVDSYSAAEVARAAIETVLKRAHHGLFAPIFWFVVLGPAGAVLYRLAHLLTLEWHAHENNAFNQFTKQAFEWLDWLPARVTASSFAIVGDFEDAVYCWRTHASGWSDKALGIVLASGAGALGVRLGEPLPQDGVDVHAGQMHTDGRVRRITEVNLANLRCPLPQSADDQ